jgi:hypothetical protein
MLWAGIIAGGAGLVLSARYRVGAVVAAGILGIFLVLGASLFTSWTFLTTLSTIAVMLCALNFGYVSGLALLCAWAARPSAKHESTAFASRHAAAPANARGIAMPDLHR